MPRPKRRKLVRGTAGVPVVLRMRVWRDGPWYVGQLRELPAVISQGKTLPELRANVRDAYRLLLKGLRRRQSAASA